MPVFHYVTHHESLLNFARIRSIMNRAKIGRFEIAYMIYPDHAISVFFRIRFTVDFDQFRLYDLKPSVYQFQAHSSPSLNLISNNWLNYFLVISLGQCQFNCVKDALWRKHCLWHVLKKVTDSLLTDIANEKMLDICHSKQDLHLQDNCHNSHD